MDPFTIGLLGIVIMFVLIILQVPIGVSMGIAGVVAYGFIAGFNQAFAIVANEVSSILSNANYAVIPLFLLMGNFAVLSGLSTDVYKVAYAYTGHRKGGLAVATIFGCAFFGAVCGSSAATAATFGKVALPEMLKRGYSRELATGCVAAGGTLGALVPPSGILIIYAIMSEQFILTLFTASYFPAAIVVTSFLLAVYFYLKVHPDAAPAGPRLSWHERYRLSLSCWGVLLIIAAVFGGLYGGVFTVTEAAAVGTVITFGFSLGRRKLTGRSFWDALSSTALSTGMIYAIILGANIMSYYITVSHLPDVVIAHITESGLPKLIVMGILLIIYLMLGSIFDTVAAMLITLPFVLPIITAYGYSPIWWGIMNNIIIEIGMITPPIGINVFVLHGVRPDIPLGVIFRGIGPFVFAGVVQIILLLIFPQIAMFLTEIIK